MSGNTQVPACLSAKAQSDQADGKIRAYLKMAAAMALSVLGTAVATSLDSVKLNDVQGSSSLLAFPRQPLRKP